ncbi:hypothetical protein TSAR_012764 [Trichomalopsis sarcophagae]|uniref:Protein-S-isoprenylcysteine O-methyltransferase n=1 Tax=Trichomalopsis sarcophagae TaxID=543379 RepID=A0A232EXP3_9HYME|nr:hypothetical protein TSAR_012764 [Trichomalopsis sarcophagae]
MKHFYEQIGLFSFFSSLVTNILFNQLLLYLLKYCYNSILQTYWIQLVTYGFSIIIIKIIYRSPFYEISSRANFLGFCLSLGILICNSSIYIWKTFGIYVTVLSTFHFTEFLGIAFTNPASLSFDSFVINHSPAYTLAAIASWTEFGTRVYFFPNMKPNLCLLVIGTIFCVAGEILRKTAIFTAKQNFNHIVQSKKSNHHSLVTHGVYNVCRHPSYVGWFYWSIGTQLILHNPICLLAYIIISWKFFEDRIFIEELSLVEFYGDAYKIYQNNVGTGLPFISGYIDAN